MKLYRVDYYEWNYTFSDLLPRQMLSVGKDAEEAIANVKPRADSDARNFSAISSRRGSTWRMPSKVFT